MEAFAFVLMGLTIMMIGVCVSTYAVGEVNKGSDEIDSEIIKKKIRKAKIIPIAICSVIAVGVILLVQVIESGVKPVSAIEPQAHTMAAMPDIAIDDSVVGTEELPTPPEDESESAEPTMGQKNALAKAESYLEFTAFSHKGLVEQLEFEKFSHEEAVYGANHCGADWNEQAAIKAESYLEFMAFSRDELIEQLEYEGFSRKQAVYGVEAVGY